MDDNKLRSAQGGASIEASRWKTAECRQMKVKQIMDTLFKHAHHRFVSNPSEAKKIAESLEEKANATAKDETEYLAKISSDMWTLVASYQNSGQDEASSSVGVDASAGNVDWQEQAYQKVKRIKSTYFAKLNELYRYTCTKLAHHQQNLTSTQPQPTTATKSENSILVKKMLEEIFVQLNVTKGHITPAFKEKLDYLEEQIQGVTQKFYSRLRGLKSAKVQRGLLAVASQTGISQVETPERKPNLEVKNLHSSPSGMQTPKQNTMHSQGQSAKQVSEKEQSGILGHQVEKESRSSQQQQNQLSSMKGDTKSHLEKCLAFSNCGGNIVRQETTSDELQSTRAFFIDSLGISPSALLEEYCRNQNEVSVNTVQQTNFAPKSNAPYLDEIHRISAPTSLQGCSNPNKISKNSTFSSDNFTPGLQCLVRTQSALTEEIREINKLLIDAEVVMREENIITIATAGADDGFVVECFFRGATIDWNAMPPSVIKPLRLLIPTNYPTCSPIFLDEMPVQISKHVEDLSTIVKSKLCSSLRSRMLPFSLRDIAILWETCSREVIIEIAQQHGGGTFSSKYGGWEKVYH